MWWLLAEPSITETYITVSSFLIAIATIVSTLAIAVWKGLLPLMKKAQEAMAEMNKHCHTSLDESTKRFTDALKERDERMREQTREFNSTTAALARLHDAMTSMERRLEKWGS